MAARNKPGTKKILVVMPEDLLTAIDGEAGTDRSSWIVDACRKSLTHDAWPESPERFVRRRRPTRSEATPIPKSSWK